MHYNVIPDSDVTNTYIDELDMAESVWNSSKNGGEVYLGSDKLVRIGKDAITYDNAPIPVITRSSLIFCPITVGHGNGWYIDDGTIPQVGDLVLVKGNADEVFRIYPKTSYALVGRSTWFSIGNTGPYAFKTTNFDPDGDYPGSGNNDYIKIIDNSALLYINSKEVVDTITTPVLRITVYSVIPFISSRGDNG